MEWNGDVDFKLLGLNDLCMPETSTLELDDLCMPETRIKTENGAGIDIYQAASWRRPTSQQAKCLLRRRHLYSTCEVTAYRI